MDKTTLGTRMKNYERISSLQLMRRTPVIIRLDGKAFHSFTKGMKKPFDDELMLCMARTTQYLVKNIEGCDFGYMQSDEISLLLTDYKRLETQPWFDYKVQKIVSVASSMCTFAFNRFFYERFNEQEHTVTALFDARAFNLPRDEVVNYFIWREKDWTRNSIQMLGRSYFSQKQLHGKSCNEIQELLFQEKGINWNDIETHKKRGTCCYKLKSLDASERTEYKIDYEIPIFTQNRYYIQKWIDIDKE